MKGKETDVLLINREMDGNPPGGAVPNKKKKSSLEGPQNPGQGSQSEKSIRKQAKHLKMLDEKQKKKIMKMDEDGKDAMEVDPVEENEHSGTLPPPPPPVVELKSPTVEEVKPPLPSLRKATMTIEEAKAKVAAAKLKKEYPDVELCTVFIEGVPKGTTAETKGILEAYGVSPTMIWHLSFVGGDTVSIVTKKDRVNKIKETIGKHEDLRVLEQFNPLLNKYAPQLGPHPAAIQIMKQRLESAREAVLKNKDYGVARYFEGQLVALDQANAKELMKMLHGANTERVDETGSLEAAMQIEKIQAETETPDARVTRRHAEDQGDMRNPGASGNPDAQKSHGTMKAREPEKDHNFNSLGDSYGGPGLERPRHLP